MAAVAPRGHRAPALCGCLAVAALLLSGCAAATTSAVTVSGKTLTIYYSRPPAGAGGQAAADVFDAEALAAKLSGDTAGRFHLRFVPVAKAELTDDARVAIQNTTAIAYVGEIQPGTSLDTVPITNELGLLEVSPTDTSDSLTQATPAVSGSPGNVYPSSSTFHRTFARVVPSTAAEARALVSEMRSVDSGGGVYVAPGDGSAYGDAIAAEVAADAKSSGLKLASTPGGAAEIFYGAIAGPTAARTLDALERESPGAKLFAPSGLYDETFVAGLSPRAQSNLYVSSPGFMPGSLPAGGRAFDTAFAAAYGHRPAPEAIFGAEAIDAVVDVLKKEGANAGSRADVVGAFRALRNHDSPLIGTYSIAGGDTSIAPFVIARERDGALVATGAI